MELGDAEVVEEKRSKVKDFFKGKLRRSSEYTILLFAGVREQCVVFG